MVAAPPPPPGRVAGLPLAALPCLQAVVEAVAAYYTPAGVEEVGVPTPNSSPIDAAAGGRPADKSSWPTHQPPTQAMDIFGGGDLQVLI